MKHIKKLIALACVATMLVPTLAYATEGQATPEEVPMTGDSVVENDNSKEYEYTSVVLPTTNDSTYDFQIDRDGLFPKYDSANTYESGTTVYFHAENDAASIALNTDSAATHGLFEIGKDVHIAKGAELADVEASALGTALKGSAIADLATTLPANTYYVWTPQETDDNGLGEWTALTADNIGNYLKLTDDGTNYTAVELQPDPLSGEHIWDGNIYVIKFTAITDGEKAVVDYNVKADGTGAITSLKDGLYVCPTGSEATLTAYEALDIDNVATYIDYTAATDWYAGTSDKATVYNKSTSPIAVSVDVKVTAEGLTFSADGIYTSDAAASVYFTVSDGTNKTVINENGAATAYYVLNGADNGYETFQGSTYDDETGSHNYYKYEQPNATYDSQSFVITATANAEDGSDDAWVEYITSIENGTVVKPTIEVVYNWIEVEETDTDGVFKDIDENTYTVKTMNADGVTIDDGWATVPVTFVASHTFSNSSDGSKFYFTPSPTGSVTSANVYLADDYTENGSSATVKYDIKSATSVASSGNVLITKSTLDSTITDAGKYAIVIVIGEKTYTFAYTKSAS